MPQFSLWLFFRTIFSCDKFSKHFWTFYYSANLEFDIFLLYSSANSLQIPPRWFPHIHMWYFLAKMERRRRNWTRSICITPRPSFRHWISFYYPCTEYLTWWNTLERFSGIQKSHPLRYPLHSTHDHHFNLDAEHVPSTGRHIKHVASAKVGNFLWGSKSSSHVSRKTLLQFQNGCITYPPTYYFFF